MFPDATITTDRLTLRPFRPADARWVEAAGTDPPEPGRPGGVRHAGQVNQAWLRFLRR
jgi:hypothetical protein